MTAVHADYTATPVTHPARYTEEQIDAGAAVLASAFIPGIPWEQCGAHERAELRKRSRAFLDAVAAVR
jgi:hypothetical protein